MPLAVHYLPSFVSEAELADSLVVVVDLLRASTTICQALASGAKAVLPSVEVSETLAQAQRYDRSEVALGGERGGKRIEGFDLGNSPAEYTADQVFGQTVLFTTTNGTRALAHARLATRIVIGSAVNRKALVDVISSEPKVNVLCAGTGGQVTREDILAAGAIVDLVLEQVPGEQHDINQWADAARGEWRELLATARATGRSTSEQLALELRDTIGGRNLLALGYDADLVACAQLDTLDIVPELERASGELRLP